MTIKIKILTCARNRWGIIPPQPVTRLFINLQRRHVDSSRLQSTGTKAAPSASNEVQSSSDKNTPINNLRSHPRSSAEPKPIYADTTLFRSVKYGMGILVASASPDASHANNSLRSSNYSNFVSLTGKVNVRTNTHHKVRTRFTKLSHQAPVRLVPFYATNSFENAGVAVCSLGSYGGGILPGDSLDYNIHVQPQATVGLVTQGSTRIYSSNKVMPLNSLTDGKPSSAMSMRLMACSHMDCTIEANGTLVYTPDPVVLYKDSVYDQQSIYRVQDPISSSLLVVDWISSGR
jgi:hypothetical protein